MGEKDPRVISKGCFYLARNESKSTMGAILERKIGWYVTENGAKLGSIEKEIFKIHILVFPQ